MSRRTAEAGKAIRLAWQREYNLVQEGKGTRNWTEDQQRDILDPDKGKAYDDKGRAFEGQHMKSVGQYPEFQGDPDNIQFLTKDEHLEAHQGNWQNPTNWYYDPVTKQFSDFGSGKYVPCPVIELSKPISGYNTPADTNDVCRKTKSECTEDKSSEPHVPSPQTPKVKPPNPKEVVPQKEEIFKRIIEGAAKGLKKAGSFVVENKEIIGAVVLTVGGEIAKHVVSNSHSRSQSPNNNSQLYEPQDRSVFPSSISDYESSSATEPDIDSNSEESSENSSRGPKGEETVRPHRQRYNGVWKDKESYKRGGKKASDSDEE